MGKWELKYDNININESRNENSYFACSINDAAQFRTRPEYSRDGFIQEGTQRAI
jgi:hypothetical protein